MSSQSIKARLEENISYLQFMLQDLSDPLVKEYALTNLISAP